MKFKICKGTIYQFFNYWGIMEPVTSINSGFIHVGEIPSVSAALPSFMLQAQDPLSHCSLLLLSAAFHCGERGRRSGDGHG